jgi:hypothetical protein
VLLIKAPQELMQLEEEEVLKEDLQILEQVLVVPES